VARVSVAGVGVGVDAGETRVRRGVVEDDDLVDGEDGGRAGDTAYGGGFLFAGDAANRRLARGSCRGRVRREV
jgi:hypothetical protein